MNTFRLNRNVFKAQTAKEATDHSQYYRKLSWQERLQISAYLNSIAYNHPFLSPPPMDKTKFCTRCNH